MLKFLKIIVIFLVFLISINSALANELSTNSSLKSLQISTGNLTPKFHPDIYSYSVSVTDKTEAIKINAVCNNCQSISGTGAKNLIKGVNSFSLIVIAEDGINKSEYKIKINRGNAAGTEESAYLKSLVIENYEISPTFDKMNNLYTATVPTDVENIDLFYNPENPNAEVVFDGNKNLEIGENIVTVTVLNGSLKQVYKIIVTREKKAVNASEMQDGSKELIVNGYNNDFTKLLLIFGTGAIVITLLGIALFKKKDKKRK